VPPPARARNSGFVFADLGQIDLLVEHLSLAGWQAGGLRGTTCPSRGPMPPSARTTTGKTF
jgi:hypothetical protein